MWQRKRTEQSVGIRYLLLAMAPMLSELLFHQQSSSRTGKFWMNSLALSFKQVPSPSRGSDLARVCIFTTRVSFSCLPWGFIRTPRDLTTLTFPLPLHISNFFPPLPTFFYMPSVCLCQRDTGLDVPSVWPRRTLFCHKAARLGN